MDSSEPAKEGFPWDLRAAWQVCALALSMAPAAPLGKPRCRLLALGPIPAGRKLSHSCQQEWLPIPAGSMFDTYV